MEKWNFSSPNKWLLGLGNQKGDYSFVYNVDLEGDAGISVGGEDLCDRVDVGSSPEVNSEIQFISGDHDVLGCSLHRVIQTRVDNVLLTGTSHTPSKVVVG